ncbi:MAG: hypothetical protein QMD06_04060, partial [Candidatus Altarchaeum sp.]|nr:hypothetical protein [Candidatus Altarchaeum sp.]
SYRAESISQFHKSLSIFKISYNYLEFGSFKKAITNCFEQTNTTYKKDLDSLLTLRFQKFKNTQFVKL